MDEWRQIGEMNVFDFFNQKGVKVSIEGKKPQILDDTSYVWMVGQGRISVFLANLSEDNCIGAKKFLFELGQGELLFGIASEELEDKKVFLASGPVGCSLIRLEANQLEKLHEEMAAEAILLVEQWINTLSGISIGDGISLAEIASTEEKQLSAYGFLKDPLVWKEYHNQVLQAATKLWEEENQAEKIRLQEKERNNRRIIANAIAKLASVSQKNKRVDMEESSGNLLLDTCRLVGKAMDIMIVPPLLDRSERESSTSLEVIVQASHIRRREVALKGEWYKQDCGPILGYMQEDDRPIALIPSTPSTYILHDLVLGVKKVVDKDMASRIKPFGFVFYRTFDQKNITLWELVYFGYKSCWKRDLIMIVCMGLLGGMLGTAIPLASGIVFNSIIPESEKGQLLQIALFLGVSVFAMMIFQFIRSLATLRMEGKMDGSIQASVWDRLISLPVPFFKQFTAGELAMRAMGISRIRTILSGVTLNAILSGIFSVVTFVLLFFYDTGLAGIATAMVVLAVLVMASLGYLQVRYEQKVLEISNKICGMMLQLIGGIIKFRVAGAENRAFHQWAKEFSEQRKLTFKRDTIGNWLTTFNAFFPILSSMVIFYFLTSTSNSLPPGKFVAFNSAFVSFMLFMVSLSEALISANMVIPLYHKAKPILESLPEYDDTKINPKPLTGSIEVSHVSFRYRKESALILKDISFQINKGDYVAIVGASGCGKSTLLRILLGFEEPEAGKIYYNGQDLSKVDIRAVRKQLGVVLQNGELMSGDILSNIIGANPYLTVDDAWEAARMAGIEEDIKEMPMGMHTYICEGSGAISGGQKQRIMIARAIVNKPKIIFFDEATSALDNHTQAVVSQSLDKLQATRIVIAHRLSTIINCSRIFVMDKGEIVESGTYQELMENKGVFADLVKRQLA